MVGDTKDVMNQLSNIDELIEVILVDWMPSCSDDTVIVDQDNRMIRYPVSL